MAAEAHAPTAGEYIIHHLHHLRNAEQTAVADFGIYNIDSIIWAALLGALTSSCAQPPRPLILTL